MTNSALFSFACPCSMLWIYVRVAVVSDVEWGRISLPIRASMSVDFPEENSPTIVILNSLFFMRETKSSYTSGVITLSSNAFLAMNFSLDVFSLYSDSFRCRPKYIN